MVGLFGLGLGLTISILDPFLYTEKVRLLAPPHLKNSVLGLLTILTLLVALVVQPVVGRLSDRTRSRWGRRIPYMTAGAIGLSVALGLLVLADSLWLLILAAMLTSAATNTTQGAWQALIPDRVPVAQHGRAAGIKTLLEVVGVVAGVAVAGLTLARGNLWSGPLLAITVFFAILLITVIVLRRTGETTNGRTHTAGVVNGKFSLSTVRATFSAIRPFAVRYSPFAPRSPLPALRSSLPALRSPLPALRSLPQSLTPAFRWWMLNRFLFWSAAIAIRTFMLNYMADVLHIPPAEAQAVTSRLLLIIGGGVFVLALPAGIIADRIGRRPLVLAAGLMAAMGAFGFIFWRDVYLLFLAGGLIAAGAGIYASASWALATDLAPLGQGAQYLALANAATVLGSIGGRMGGPLIDGVNQLTGSASLGYLIIFAIAGLFFVGSSLVVMRMAEKRGHRDVAN